MIGERKLDRDALGVRGGELGQRRVVAVLAGAEKYELGVRRTKQVGAEDDIQPLLGHQARTHAEQRRMGARRQPVGALQRRLAAPLAGEIVDVVVRRDVGVGLGVPGFRVDPVEDPRDPVA